MVIFKVLTFRCWIFKVKLISRQEISMKLGVRTQLTFAGTV